MDWWSLVWFPFSIPKQAFITWLAMRDALTTGRKLLIWAFQRDMKCIFCRHVIEDRDHLLFACGYSSRIWQQVMILCSMLNLPSCWEDVVQFFGVGGVEGQNYEGLFVSANFCFYNI